MIQASFTRQDGHLVQAELTGHAGSGEFGFDVICAAVSALSINFVNSLVSLTDCQPDLDIDEIEGGYLKVGLPQEDEKAQLLFESYLLGLTNLSQHHPEFVNLAIITN